MAEPKAPEGVKPPESNDTAALLARLDKLEASNTRLVGESSAHKKRAQDAEAKVTEHENAKLEAEGNYKERLEKEIAEKQKISETLVSTRKKVLQSTLRSDALKYAPDAHDIDDVLKSTEHKDLLTLDEENLTVAGTEEFVKKIKELKPWLFKNAKLPVTDHTRPKVPNAPLNTTSGFDAEAYKAELSATKNQADYDKVLKKFGRDGGSNR